MLDKRSAAQGTFDVYLQLEDLDDVRTKPAIPEWVHIAIEDVLCGPSGPLRSFIWRYGIDVRRQRGSFRPLVEVALMYLTHKLEKGSRLVHLVSEAFPDLRDALTLKQDIIDGVLLPSAQLDVLRFVFEQGGDAVFPSPSLMGVSRLAQLWPNQSDELLHLAEGIADIEGELETSVFEAISRAVPSEEFWTLTERYPRLRERMVAACPELLTSDSARLLDDGTLVSFVESMDENHEIGQLLIPQVLSRDNSRLAEILIGLYPQAVAMEVVVAIDSGLEVVGPAWMQALIKRPSVLLDPMVMIRISRTSLLFSLAEQLGWLSGPVVSAGTKPWVSGVVGATSDLPDEKRAEFEAYLVSLALACGEDGGQALLEKFFGGVHQKILSGRLPWLASTFLSPYLPDVGWLRSWDTALRFRLAVASGYVRYGYSAESYAKLGRNKKERVMLAEAATEVNGGDHLARAISIG